MGYLWLIKVRKREALKGGNVSLSRNKGFASMSFLSSISMILRADFVSPYFESCSFCLQSNNRLLDSYSTLNSKWETMKIVWKKGLMHLKFSRVSSWVISLKRSSLNDANTLRSFTRISTAFGRSFLNSVKEEDAKWIISVWVNENTNNK